MTARPLFLPHLKHCVESNPSIFFRRLPLICGLFSQRAPRLEIEKHASVFREAITAQKAEIKELNLTLQRVRSVCQIGEKDRKHLETQIYEAKQTERTVNINASSAVEDLNRQIESLKENGDVTLRQLTLLRDELDAKCAEAHSFEQQVSFKVSNLAAERDSLLKSEHELIEGKQLAGKEIDRLNAAVEATVKQRDALHEELTEQIRGILLSFCFSPLFHGYEKEKPTLHWSASKSTSGGALNTIETQTSTFLTCKHCLICLDFLFFSGCRFSNPQKPSKPSTLRTSSLHQSCVLRKVRLRRIVISSLVLSRTASTSWRFVLRVLCRLPPRSRSCFAWRRRRPARRTRRKSPPSARRRTASPAKTKTSQKPSRKCA